MENGVWLASVDGWLASLAAAEVVEDVVEEVVPGLVAAGFAATARILGAATALAAFATFARLRDPGVFTAENCAAGFAAISQGIAASLISETLAAEMFAPETLVPVAEFAVAAGAGAESPCPGAVGISADASSTCTPVPSSDGPFAGCVPSAAGGTVSAENAPLPDPRTTAFAFSTPSTLFTASAVAPGKDDVEDGFTAAGTGSLERELESCELPAPFARNLNPVPPPAMLHEFSATVFATAIPEAAGNPEEEKTGSAFAGGRGTGLAAAELIVARPFCWLTCGTESVGPNEFARLLWEPGKLLAAPEISAFKFSGASPPPAALA